MKREHLHDQQIRFEQSSLVQTQKESLLPLHAASSCQSETCALATVSWQPQMLCAFHCSLSHSGIVRSWTLTRLSLGGSEHQSEGTELNSNTGVTSVHTLLIY